MLNVSGSWNSVGKQQYIRLKNKYHAFIHIPFSFARIEVELPATKKCSASIQVNTCPARTLTCYAHLLNIYIYRALA